MNTLPNLQTQIYGLSNQFNEIAKLFDNNQLPNRILLYGNKGSGKSTLAYHLINYFFSKNETYPYDLNKNMINEENKSFKLINNFSHPNFYLIDLLEEKKHIEISQIRSLFQFTNKSTFNNLPKYILIDNLESINKNSANALLKVLEEPNEKVFFILVQNSNKRILNTLKSRCLIFNISHSFTKSVNITNKLLNDNIFNLINIDILSHYNTPGDLINLINFSIKNNLNLSEINLRNFINILIDQNYYKKDKYMKFNIYHFLELYLLKIFKNTDDKNHFFLFYSKFINKINETNKFNLDEESLFIEFKSRIMYD